MKDDSGMKLFDFTINEHGVRFRYANPHPLTANQKCGIIFAAIGVAAFVLPFWMLFRKRQISRCLAQVYGMRENTIEFNKVQ